MSVPLFVYGTLRRGGSNQHYLKNANLISKTCWVYGELHDTGFGYPVLKESQTEQVWGELYEVNQKQLKLIDQLEDYSPLSNTNEYIRVIQPVHRKNQLTRAYVYFAGEKLINCVNLIQSGNWIEYMNSHKTKLEK